MDVAESTISLETEKTVEVIGESGKNILDQVTNFSTDMWNQNKEVIVIGGLIIVFFLMAQKK